jgi:hypothetical protein
VKLLASDPREEGKTAYRRFADLTRKLAQVPKTEVDKKRAQEKRAGKRKPKPT